MIRVLPPELVSKIAAGEVVERPASVVKELVENALDAGAARISVSIWGGGVGGIEVADNGAGMDEADARLSVAHHATSKIAAEEDLEAIATLGFRGEALSSVAAVSRLTIVTKRRGGAGDAGLRLRCEGGGEPAIEPAGAPDGTRVTVEDLFFSVPARRKFLKSVRTEEALVGEALRGLALAFPAVAFSFTKDDRQLFSWPAAAEERRVEEVLGVAPPLRARGEAGGASLRAYLGGPESARRGTAGLVVVVNRRVVFDRGLCAVVAGAYEGQIDRGLYPQGVVFVEVPPATLDVNVHPQKREVRFSEAATLLGFVRRTINEAIGGETAPARPRQAPEGAAAAQPPTQRAIGLCGAETPVRIEQVEKVAEAATPGGFFSSLEPVGQLFDTYILCEGEGALVVVDQHAAAERVAFEKLRAQHRRGGVVMQALLLPVTAHIGARSVAALDENEGILRVAGIDAGPLGDDTAVVRAVPSILGGANPAHLLRDAIDELTTRRGRVEEAIEALLSRMACHGSVRAGRALGHAEMTSLLRQLDTVDFAARCPHGRPVSFTLTRKEIESKLGRR